MSWFLAVYGVVAIIMAAILVARHKRRLECMGFFRLFTMFALAPAMLLYDVVVGLMKKIKG